MDISTIVIICQSFFISTHVTAVTLSPCVNDGSVRVAEVERGKTSSFTCQGFPAGSTLEWFYVPDSGKEISSGTCDPLPNNDPGGCMQGILSPTFTASRSATEGVMTVDPTQRNGETQVGQGTLRCGNLGATDDNCQMDIITPAVLSACSVKFERVGTDWQTTGRCDISSAANSSRGRYICRWYRQKGPSSAKEQIKQVTYTPSSRVCNFTEALPTAVGVYTYSVTVTPGDVSIEASFTGEHPSAPTMTGCSADDYIAENTSVSCTCHTVNVGQPAGRLVLFRGVDSVKFGNYGDDTLTVSHTLTRADHDVIQFRCVVDWATNVQGESRTFKVGYKPERLSFKLGSGSQTEVTVKENNTVRLTCEADSRPVADMTVVRQGGLEVNSSQSPLTLTLTASCTDTGTYLCSARNVIGQADTSASGKLNVECKPRIAQTEPALELNYRNQPVSIDFDVMAYPAPNASFNSFKYLGRDGTHLASDTSNIRLNTTCQHKDGAMYIFTCTLTVHNITSPAAAGFYTVTFNNSEGSHDVRFKVLYNAPVSPSDDAVTTGNIGNGAAIGGSVAAVIVVVAIVVIIVFVMKRRKGNPKERLKSSTNAADRTRNGQGRNTYQEMEEPGFADGDQEAPSRPLSFAPMPVNTEVDRKKKKSQAAAAPEAEANGGKPADVYAEVNKPKKSNQGAAARETEANGGQPADVYADVDKTKKKQASGAVAGAKPKTGAKAAGKPKKDKKNKAKRDESDHEYGNVGYIIQGNGAKAKKTTTPSKEETSSGKMVTPEGLIYTSLEFSQPPKAGKPAPKKLEEEPVVYSDVDFKKSPPAQ